MRDESISGKLAGEYKIDLASRMSARDEGNNRRLRAVLVIDEDNGWYLRFDVERPTGRAESHALSTAIREFDR